MVSGKMAAPARAGASRGTSRIAKSFIHSIRRQKAGFGAHSGKRFRVNRVARGKGSPFALRLVYPCGWGSKRMICWGSRFTIKMAAVFLTLAQGARAQTFEVASVKLADPNAPGTMVAFPNGGTFHATGITANGCILLAYDIQAFQLMGGPSWAGGERYDILAKMPADAAGAPSGPESMQRMKTAV